MVVQSVNNYVCEKFVRDKYRTMYNKVLDFYQGVKTIRAEKKFPKPNRREGKVITFDKLRYIEFNVKVSVLLLSTTSHSIRPAHVRRWFNPIKFLKG